MFNTSLLADIIMLIHFIFVLGVIVPIPLIIFGGIYKWRWIRNPWFRYIHLAMIGIVIIQPLIGMLCPLTVWEQKLRVMADQRVYEGSFISYWVSRLIYYDLKPWVFEVIYACVGILILTLYFIFPPRRKSNLS